MQLLKPGWTRIPHASISRLGKLPSQVRDPHTWRTREDPFEEIWSKTKEFLGLNSGLEAKTLFEYFQRDYRETAVVSEKGLSHNNDPPIHA